MSDAGRKKSGGPDDVAPANKDSAGVDYSPPRRTPTSPAEKAKRRHAAHILSLEGVTGIGVERRHGEAVIVAYIRSEEVGARLPSTLDGIPLHTTVTGEIKARRRRH